MVQFGSEGLQSGFKVSPGLYGVVGGIANTKIELPKRPAKTSPIKIDVHAFLKINFLIESILNI